MVNSTGLLYTWVNSNTFVCSKNFPIFNEKIFQAAILAWKPTVIIQSELKYHLSPQHKVNRSLLEAALLLSLRTVLNSKYKTNVATLANHNLHDWQIANQWTDKSDRRHHIDGLAHRYLWSYLNLKYWQESVTIHIKHNIYEKVGRINLPSKLIRK